MNTNDLQDDSKPSNPRAIRIILLAAICVSLCCLFAIILIRIGLFDKPSSVFSLGSSNVNDLAMRASTLMNQGKFDQALPLWSQVVNQAPNWDHAYYQRALCYYNLLPHVHDLQQYQNYARSALSDMDMAIMLQPRNGDYYSFRHDVIVTFEDWEEYRVNRQAIARVAHDNIEAAIALGYSNSYRFSDRVAASDLFVLNQCDSGLSKTQQMLQATPTNDTSITGLYRMEAEGYACLGRLDEAVQAINASLQNNNYVNSKTYEKAAYLYQAGRLDEALEVLNDNLAASPNFQGYRYYLRALIRYEQGNKDQAVSDLKIGSLNTWGRYGLYSYVNGKIALEAGQKQEGIQQLQIAEATLDDHFNPLISRIKDTLTQLGAEPLDIPNSIPLSSTPIPIHQP